MDRQKLTLAGLWDEGADHHLGLTPERAQDLLDMITKLSEDRGEPIMPGRLDWLQRVADGVEPKT